MRPIILLFILGFCISCGSDPMPKPKAFLRLDYPKPEYKLITADLPFVFERNNLSNGIDKIKSSQDKTSIGLEIPYPTLKGTLYLTYKKINKNNLHTYLADAQNITQTHAIRADGITEQPFLDFEDRVFGSLFEVVGNAASQSQFYVTDSINHFLTGALYFYAKPNYDSILPAANYLKKDMQHIMETLKWKP
jgi:gliding motility-associated lipoprotein GldD